MDIHTKVMIRVMIHDWIEEHYDESIKHTQHTRSLLELIERVISTANEPETEATTFNVGDVEYSGNPETAQTEPDGSLRF